MAVEGFDFERTSASAFTRGDRELGAGAMKLIVDSLEHLREEKVQECRTTMMRDARMRLGESVDSGATRAANRSPIAPSAALIQAQTLRAQVTASLFQIDMLSKQIDQYWVEIHKKYSIPTACIVFVLVGVPLGIMSRRGGFGTAATLSLGFFVLYWACLIGGEKLADRDIVSPFVGMWSANIIVGAIGVYLTARSAKETLLIDWSVFRHLIPKRWRPAPDEEEGPNGT
jgi:lipopolysaccharide export system permease protein